jgi:hypothetical protein
MRRFSAQSYGKIFYFNYLNFHGKVSPAGIFIFISGKNDTR